MTQQEITAFIADVINDLIYIANIDNYDLIYLNESTQDLLRTLGYDEWQGKKCYEVLQGRTEPCDFCTNKFLKKDEFYYWEQKNDHLGGNFSLQDRLIELDGEEVRLTIASDITKRSTLECSLKKQLEEQKVLNECVKSFSNSKEKSEVMNNLLNILSSYFDSDASYVIDLTVDNAFFGEVFEVFQEGLISKKEQIESIPRELLDKWLERVEKLKPFYISSIDDSVDKSSVEYKILSENDVESLIVSPLTNSDNAVIGFVILVNPKKHTSNINLLRMLSKFLLDFLEKTRLISLLNIQASVDGLTEVYNKTATHKTISNVLDTKPIKNGALIMIDIDNFKELNDTYGHAFGDVALADFAKQLKYVFRKNDIIGRIGGDEFLVFLYDYPERFFIFEKAQKICDLFDKTYRKGDIEIDISISIGISFISENCTTLAELFENADSALYASKRKGKGQIVICERDAMKNEYITRIEKSDIRPNTSSFTKNKLLFIFNILYDNNDLDDAIKKVLEVLTENYCFSRGYVFELAKDKKTQSCTFEYCQHGVPPTIDYVQDMVVENYKESFVPSVYEKYYVTDFEKLPKGNAKEIITEHDVKYLINFSFWDGEEPIGFVGFADIEKPHSFSKDEIEELAAISRIIGTFLVKSRKSSKSF